MQYKLCAMLPRHWLFFVQNWLINLSETCHTCEVWTIAGSEWASGCWWLPGWRCKQAYIYMTAEPRMFKQQALYTGVSSYTQCTLYIRLLWRWWKFTRTVDRGTWLNQPHLARCNCDSPECHTQTFHSLGQTQLSHSWASTIAGLYAGPNYCQAHMVWWTHWC